MLRTTAYQAGHFPLILPKMLVLGGRRCGLDRLNQLLKVRATVGQNKYLISKSSGPEGFNRNLIGSIRTQERTASVWESPLANQAGKRGT